jgi:beta-glucosidase
MAVVKQCFERLDADSDMDPNASPLESAGSTTTPDTEISPPYSPISQHAVLKDKRSIAKRKLAELTQKEKVR